MKPDFYITVDSMDKPQLKALAAQLILENMEAEAEAQHKYNPLIYVLNRLGDTKNANMIKEVQGDEKNHLLVNQAMLNEYDGGIKIAADGAKEAIKEIEFKLEDN